MLSNQTCHIIPLFLFRAIIGVKTILISLVLLLSIPVASAQVTDIPSNIAQLFPTATRIGPQQQSPAVIPVYQLNQLLGYIFHSDDITNFPGFSGDSINLLIGLTPQGVIHGIKVLRHHEPIFIHGMGEQPMLEFIEQYIGHSIKERFVIDGKTSQSSGNTHFDGITRATVSVMVIHDTIVASSLKVARDKLEGFTPTTPFVIKPDHFQPMNFQQLLDNGYISRWVVTREQLNQLPYQAQSHAEQYLRDSNTFIELYIAPLSLPIVGKNLLGEEEFARLNDNLKTGELAIMLLNNGGYSFISQDFIPQTVPSRIKVVQDQLPIELKDIDFYSFQSPYFAQPITTFDDIQVFTIKAQSGFELHRPFDFELELAYSVNHLTRKSVSFQQNIFLPEQAFQKVAANIENRNQPLWMKIWRGKVLDITLLVAYLTIIITIFIKQKSLTTNRQQFHRIRLGCLLVTLFFIGFYLQGQLSVTNIYTLMLSLANQFKLEFFLLDPVIFILWSCVFVSLFIWGRGLFCGWLCPFGALQEILSLVAQKLKIKQIRVINTYHHYLRHLKYFILLLLVSMAFYSLEMAESLAEIEPFKTSITLYFIREIPFTLYAVILLLLSVKIHKVYCRYLCPLGAGLAILGSFPLFKWIERKQQCGAPCQLCRSKKCHIDAINLDGSINYQECVQCLECVVTIQNPNICVVSKYQNKRKRHTAIKVKSI